MKTLQHTLQLSERPWRPRAVASEACRNCGSEAAPELREQGSGLIEVLLWLLVVPGLLHVLPVLLLLLLLLPGVVYSTWRTSTRRWVCSTCHQKGLGQLQRRASMPLSKPLSVITASRSPITAHKNIEDHVGRFAK